MSYSGNFNNNHQNTSINIGRLTNDAGGIATFSDSQMLYMNQFVNDDFSEVPEDRNTAFARYIAQKRGQERRQTQIAVANARKTPLVPNIVYTKSGPTVPDKVGLPPGPANDVSVDKKWKLRKRLVVINSKRRDMVSYPNIADFKMYLGRSFSNVVELELKNLIVPNVDQAINESCNKFYWINKEDIDLGYPVYCAVFNHGSYNVATIQTEMESKLNTPNIKRRNGTSSLPHYYIITLKSDSDYVSFTSILAKLAPRDCIQTFQGTGVIRVNFDQPHGFIDNERIHIINVIGIVGGIQSTNINGAYNINVLDSLSFTFEIAQTATESAQGGGSRIRVGREAEWQLLAGEYTDSIVDRLGFRSENSSVNIPIANPLTSVTKPITGIIVGQPTKIICRDHGLVVGDAIYLHNTYLNPSVYENEKSRGAFIVSAVPTPDVFEIPFASQRISDITQAYVGTRLINVNFPNHGFNHIVDIQQSGTGIVEVTTQFNHNIDVATGVLISGSNCVPSIDGFYKTPYVTVLGPDVFQIQFSAPLTASGFKGILTTDHRFYLYGVEPFGGFQASALNNSPFHVREIIDADHFTFVTNVGYSDKTESGGGSSVRINSKLHGWGGTQDNSPNGILYKPINLSGNNYAYLCMPNIPGDLMLNVDRVSSVVGMAYLTTNPGYVIFDRFLTEPIRFDPPLPSLGDIHFQFRSPDNYLLEFNGLEWSGTLSITELVPVNENDDSSSTGLLGSSADATNVTRNIASKSF